MNLEELTTAIVDAAQDDSFDPDTTILPMINAAIQEIAGHDAGPFNRVRLPDLIASADVTFAAGEDNFQALPVNYHHDLFEAHDADTGKTVNIRTSSQTLYDLHGFVFRPGPIEDIAVDGTMLYAMPEVVETQTLKIRYYRKPALLVNDDDIPEGIPAHLHQPLIVNHVLKNIYNLIEDGMDGQKTNTVLYTQKYLSEGLAPLIAFCNGAPRKRPVIKRHAGFF